MQLRWSGHLVRMDDERLPKRLFYGEVATGSRRQGGQIRRYKDTLKSSLKCLQINPNNREELALDRPTWRRTVKTGAAIYEANRIAAAKAKREARKSQCRPVSNAAAQPLPTCPRCQRTVRALIGLVAHLRINCASRTAPTIVPRLPLPPPFRRQLTLTILLTHHFHHPPPRPLLQRRPLRRLSRAHQPTLPPPPPTPGMRIRTTPALTATVPSPQTSAWSVTCESIAQRLANQCLEHPPIPTKLVSTAHTALALSGVAWAYSATCASTTTCGRQPPVTPHIHSLPTSSTTTITPPEINIHTHHAPNCHLPRKWEVRISTRSPCGFGCTVDLSPRLSRHVKRRG
nr:unnamed protein product [Spirometra erinaceieuropaei]